MKLEQYLERRCALIDRTLKQLLADHEAPPKNLGKAMHYSLFSGGETDSAYFGPCQRGGRWRTAATHPALCLRAGK